MNYNEVVSYILDIPRFTAKNPVDHTAQLLQSLGNPQDNRKVIHVAGTNGKGSVCAYLQALLLSENKRVGMFISPHLVRMNERIRINGQEISDEEFVAGFVRTKQAASQMKAGKGAHPTFFEFLFGMAMSVFAKEDVEYIILETGMGGRLDATNAILSPLLTIITSVSLDHMKILGDTIAQIAGEKAGIIKDHIPIIYDANEPVSRSVIRQRANQLEAPCREITNHAYEIKEITDKYIAFYSTNDYYEYTTWRLSGTALYQVDNAMLALEAMQYITKDKEKHLSKWQEALSGVRWEGRMEEVVPGVYVDGAHNMGAIIRVVESILRGNSDRRDKIVILFAAVQDKEYDEMIAYLCVHMKAQSFVVTEVADARTVKAEVLAACFRRCQADRILEAVSLEEAWEIAMKEKGKDGRLYCLGSLYLAGMIKELVGRRNSDA